MRKILRLGSRGSPLALLQAGEVRKKLFQAHPYLSDEMDVEIVSIRTSGDWRPGDTELSFRETGGNKELFTKEIEEALLAKYIDMAVHSMKDVGSYLPAGLKIESVLERGDPRDAFIGSTARTLDELPQGARIGTSSLRRQAQILARRLDVRIVPMRGNLETRLEKLKAGQADAIILAMAGLTRLGLGHVATSVLEPEIMLPAAAQGAIGIEIREDDYETQKIVQTINVPETALCVQAERALLRVLDGSCHTPIGSYARVVSPSVLKLEGLAAYPDGTSLIKLDSKGALADAEQIGEQLGMRMKDMLPVNFFAA